jgi:hypothetical protein
MNPEILVTAAFLLGAAAGGLLVTLSRVRNFARVRQEFGAELNADIDAVLAEREREGLQLPHQPSPVKAA